MRVALFVTCLIDQLYPQVGRSALKVLNKLGVTVDFDRRQTCCGQPAFNTGYVDEARHVALHLQRLYAGNDLPIVVPSGSCAAMIKVFTPGLFDEGSRERAAAEDIARRTYEFSDFIVSVLGCERTGARFPEIVTYHDSCHLLRELHISEQPRRLIRQVEGIDFREMENSTRCCGFGGTFAVKFPEVSTAMGEEKIRWIRDSGARYVIGNDVSCLMHLSGLLRRKEIAVGTMHLAELLAQFND
ncbi:MAG TPA: (Fe-S)-binding protein [Acidobacteriota bacterium]|nr:(Fe-S)-binding protein [Acidobacteriota bacterium]